MKIADSICIRFKEAYLKVKFFWILLLSLLSIQSINAQRIPSRPLLFKSDGDIYIYFEETAEARQLTFCQCVREYRSSPDARYVAYTAPWAPANVWIIDLSTYETTLIADQPVNAIYTGDGTTDNAAGRMDLNWSPQNNEVAWVEFRSPVTFTSEVVIYNLDTQTRRIVSRSGEWVTQGDANPLSWDDGGLIYMTYIRDTQSQFVNVVNPDGSEIYRGIYEGVFPPSWIEIDGKHYLVWRETLRTDNFFTVFDPTTEEFQVLEGHIIICSALVENSICTYNTRVNNHPRFHIIFPDGSIQEIQYYARLSTDGQAYVYYDDSNHGYIWRDGVTTSLPATLNIQDFDWGPLEFRFIAP